MYRKILVPLDGSMVAESVLPHTRSFAAGLSIPVHLLQVIDLDSTIPSGATEPDRFHNISKGIRSKEREKSHH